ncbi:MAG: hypothetical protein C4338_04140 [Rhodanobacteraceae bacterium]
MFEHTDVRVRHGRRSASIAGESRQQDVAETIASGANGFGDFCRNKSSPLAAASGTQSKLAMQTQ